MNGTKKATLRMSLWTWPLTVMLIATAGFAAPRQISHTGEVTDVTLYRGQAQVVREIPVSGPAGPIELTVTDLPARLESASMFAEADQGLEVRAVRYRPRAVGEVPDDKLAELDRRMIDVQDELALIEQKRELLAKRATYLDNLEGFVAATAKAELSSGVLDADALEKITAMSFGHREEIATLGIDLRKEERDLRQRLNLLQRQRAELAHGTRKTVHEAVLFLDKAAAGDATVRLTYTVNGCGWSPSYNFRANAADQQVEIEYNALVQQMSGEDWTGVQLTLSTATPRLSAAAPGLAPFRVALTEGADPYARLGGQALRQQVEGIRLDLSQAQASQFSQAKMADNLAANWRMNANANEYQMLELANDEENLDAFRPGRGASDNGPAMSYRIPTPVSLASRSDQQMIRITAESLPGTFYHTATPVLSAHVYRQADLKNTTGLDLLRGEANMYLDGRFVGRMEIPTVARGQTVVLGLGADPQLNTSRQLVTREQTTQGGNQVVAFEYRLVVENYRDQPVAVRVFDRLPHTDHDKDLRVTLGEMDDELSDDPVYLRLDRPKGILRWDIQVPANAAGAEARMVEYDYTLEYARQYHLTTATQGANQPGGPAPAEEFKELQQDRMRY